MFRVFPKKIERALLDNLNQDPHASFCDPELEKVCAEDPAQRLFHIFHDVSGYECLVEYFSSIPRRPAGTGAAAETEPEKRQPSLHESQFLQIIRKFTSCNTLQAKAILDLVDVYKGGEFNFKQFYLIVTLFVAMDCRMTTYWFFIHQDQLVELFLLGGKESLIRKVSCLANVLGLLEVTVVRYLLINNGFEHAQNLQHDETALMHGLFEVFRFYDASFTSTVNTSGKAPKYLNDDFTNAVAGKCSIL